MGRKQRFLKRHERVKQVPWSRRKQDAPEELDMEKIAKRKLKAERKASGEDAGGKKRKERRPSFVDEDLEPDNDASSEEQDQEKEQKSKSKSLRYHNVQDVSEKKRNKKKTRQAEADEERRERKMSKQSRKNRDAALLGQDVEEEEEGDDLELSEEEEARRFWLVAANFYH